MLLILASGLDNQPALQPFQFAVAFEWHCMLHALSYANEINVKWSTIDDDDGDDEEQNRLNKTQAQ